MCLCFRSIHIEKLFHLSVVVVVVVVVSAPPCPFAAHRVVMGHTSRKIRPVKSRVNLSWIMKRLNASQSVDDYFFSLEALFSARLANLYLETQKSGHVRTFRTSVLVCSTMLYLEAIRPDDTMFLGDPERVIPTAGLVVTSSRVYTWRDTSPIEWTRVARPKLDSPLVAPVAAFLWRLRLFLAANKTWEENYASLWTLFRDKRMMFPADYPDVVEASRCVAEALSGGASAAKTPQKRGSEWNEAGDWWQSRPVKASLSKNVNILSGLLSGLHMFTWGRFWKWMVVFLYYLNVKRSRTENLSKLFPKPQQPRLKLADGSEQGVTLPPRNPETHVSKGTVPSQIMSPNVLARRDLVTQLIAVYSEMARWPEIKRYARGGEEKEVRINYSKWMNTVYTTSAKFHPLLRPEFQLFGPAPDYGWLKIYEAAREVDPTPLNLQTPNVGPVPAPVAAEFHLFHGIVFASLIAPIFSGGSDSRTVTPNGRTVLDVAISTWLDNGVTLMMTPDYDKKTLRNQLERYLTTPVKPDAFKLVIGLQSIDQSVPRDAFKGLLFPMGNLFEPTDMMWEPIKSVIASMNGSPFVLDLRYDLVYAFQEQKALDDNRYPSTRWMDSGDWWLHNHDRPLVVLWRSSMDHSTADWNCYTLLSITVILPKKTSVTVTVGGKDPAGWTTEASVLKHGSTHQPRLKPDAKYAALHPVSQLKLSVHTPGEDEFLLSDSELAGIAGEVGKPIPVTRDVKKDGALFDFNPKQDANSMKDATPEEKEQTWKMERIGLALFAIELVCNGVYPSQMQKAMKENWTNAANLRKHVLTNYWEQVVRKRANEFLYRLYF